MHFIAGLRLLLNNINPDDITLQNRCVDYEEKDDAIRATREFAHIPTPRSARAEMVVTQGMHAGAHGSVDMTYCGVGEPLMEMVVSEGVRH